MTALRDSFVQTSWAVYASLNCPCLAPAAAQYSRDHKVFFVPLLQLLSECFDSLLYLHDLSVIRSISIALCQRSSGKEQPTLRSNRRFKRSTEVAGSRANLIYSRYGKEVVVSRPTSSSSNSHWSNLSSHRCSFPMC